MTRCAHTMRVSNRNGSVSCGDCGKTLKKAPKPKTITLRGAQAHRFLRSVDPTFPLHPDEKPADEEAAHVER